MITCPWCGTSYLAFQSNCRNCGGILPAPAEAAATAGAGEAPVAPPPAPRPISSGYAWRLLASDGWWVAALVFGLLGVIFSGVGAVLTAGIITAFVGIPFLVMGLAFLGGAALLLGWRYQRAQKVVSVLRDGDPARGKITECQQNYSVRVNGRCPWTIGYDYQVGGHTYTGTVSTLNPPGLRLDAGSAVTVLYLPTDPRYSSIYPHP